jgi:tight adherence protein B
MIEWLAAVAIVAAVAIPLRRPAVTRISGGGPETPLVVAGGRGRWLAAAVVGSAVVATRLSIVALGGLAVAAVVGERVRRSCAHSRSRRDCELAAIEVTVALAAELRAGRTSAEALAAVAEIAGPLRPALEAAHVAVVLGADAAQELSRAADLPGAEGLRGVSAAWAVSTSAGGRVAVVLERLSEAMDSDAELRQELAAVMAGPRATMTLLAALPALGLALGQAIGAHPLQLLVHRPLGWGLLGAAAVLDAIGVVVTQAIARRAARG